MSVTADLSPPLGFPGGPCHLKTRVEQTVRNPRYRDMILDTIEVQGHLDKSQERVVYDRHVEKDRKGRIILPGHVQHRMDQRGITVPEIKLAIKEFMISNSSQRRLFEHGERVRMVSKIVPGLFVALEKNGRDRVVVTTYWEGQPDPRPQTCFASRLAMASRLAQKTHLRVPYSFKPVKLLKPKRKRKKWPFQGYVDFQGLKIDIENKAGSTRKGTSEDGVPWSIKMNYHYGEIRGTGGADGDLLDVYLGPNADSPLVVVVHQQDPKTKVYDEDKVLLGWDDVREAVKAYKGQYDGPGFYQDKTVINIGEFWRWCHTKRNKGKRVKKAYAHIEVQLV